MMGFGGAAPLVTSAIYVCNLPPGSDEMLLADHFGKIGLLKKDKRTGNPKIWIYRDKITNEPKGDATITYEDPHAATAAVEWFNSTEFHGNIISVSIAENKKDVQPLVPEIVPLMMDAPLQGVAEFGTDPNLGGEYGEEYGGDYSGDYGGEYGGEHGGGAGGPPGLAGGRGRGRGDGKPWQQEGDWPCPNPSCANINFAFRGVCNRCGTARPAGNSGGGGGGAGGGRGRGRGGSDAGRGGRGPGGPPGLFGPNDWNCPMCGNINWAKRTKCNICNTTKPGHNEGGAREGRAGGYKEFDEAEIEETKRRRKELEEDDGEMYDEFGNLKKKFRTKAKVGEPQTAATPAVTGVGKAGWDKEDLGVVERQTKEKSKDRSGLKDDYDREHSQGRRGDHRDMDSGRNGHRDNDYEKDRGRGRDERDDREGHRDRDRDWDRDRGGHPDKDRDRARSRDRSRDRDWDRGRGGRDRERDRERDRDRERERDREWPRERERVRERDRFMD